MGSSRQELAASSSASFLISLSGTRSPIRVRLDLYRDGRKKALSVYSPMVEISPGFVSPPDDDEPVVICTTISPPKLIHRVDPEYPDIARRARIEGKVILELIVDRKGGVRDARVLRSVPLLDEAAMAAVRKWRYSPARDHGRPVTVYFTVYVDFKLPHAETPAGD